MMAKKKPVKPNNQSFAHNPFKDLKGLPVSSSPPDGTQKPEVQGEKTTQSINGGGERSFAEEMAWLGVEPFTEEDNQKESSYDREDASARRSSSQEVTESEQLEFTRAIGQLDKPFKDQWPEENDDDPPSAQPRRMKQLQKGQLFPETEIDLHGMSRAEALHRVRYFLENAVHRGLQVALIITGKGAGSGSGPVLKKAVMDLLGDMSEMILEWGEAPRRYGGSGALVVFLRKKLQERTEQ